MNEIGRDLSNSVRRIAAKTSETRFRQNHGPSSHLEPSATRHQMNHDSHRTHYSQGYNVFPIVPTRHSCPKSLVSLRGNSGTSTVESLHNGHFRGIPVRAGHSELVRTREREHRSDVAQLDVLEGRQLSRDFPEHVVVDIPSLAETGHAREEGVRAEVTTGCPEKERLSATGWYSRRVRVSDFFVWVTCMSQERIDS